MPIPCINTGSPHCSLPYRNSLTKTFLKLKKSSDTPDTGVQFWGHSPANSPAN